MSQHKTNKHNPYAKCNFSDYTIFIAAYIKNSAFAINITMIKGFSDIGKTIPIGVLDDRYPFPHYIFTLGAANCVSRANMNKTSGMKPRLRTNCILYHNLTLLSELIKEKEKNQFEEVEIITQISSTAWKHINFMGRYEFNTPTGKTNVSEIVKELIFKPLPKFQIPY